MYWKTKENFVKKIFEHPSKRPFYGSGIPWKDGRGVSGNQQKGTNEPSTVQFPRKTESGQIEDKSTKMELQ